jgi:hypothetical protein
MPLLLEDEPPFLLVAITSVEKIFHIYFSNSALRISRTHCYQKLFSNTPAPGCKQPFTKYKPMAAIPSTPDAGQPSEALLLLL